MNSTRITPTLALAVCARRSVVAAILMVLLESPAWAQSNPPIALAPGPSGVTPVFVENRGQWEGDFAYRTQLGPMTVFVQRNGWTFTLVEPHGRPTGAHDSVHARGFPGHACTRGVAVSMHFGGSARADAVIAEKPCPGVHNYFIGRDPTRWQSNVPLHESVRLVNVWRGIDVRTRIEDGHFEYDVLASPGADLGQISIEVTGADGLRLGTDGTLVIETPLGPVHQPVPKTWQIMADGRREPVSCAYVVLSANRFMFVAPTWDRERRLVIDPGLIYSTFLGGGVLGDSYAYAVALDATGAATVAGATSANNFPTTPGAFDTSYSHSGNTIFDAFVTRLGPNGDTLIYSTFLGGGGVGDSYAYAVALDPTGAATVGGATTADNFPTTAGAFDTSYNHSGNTIFDGFVTRLSPSGDALMYSTFLGGGGVGDSYAYAVALDPTGAATVAGATTADNFPTTPGAFDTSYSHSGNTIFDGFVTRLSPNGSALTYSTFLRRRRG